MADPISRREFLKLLGWGAAGLTLSLFLPVDKILGNVKHSLREPSNTPLPPAYAQSSGSWSLGQNTTVVAIHAALLPTGKIFYLAGSGYHPNRSNGPFEARILNLGTGLEKNLTQSDDLFCIGITSLKNGNLILAGGTLMYDSNPDNCNGEFHGLNAVYELDVQTENLNWVTSMAHGRWYPTLVTLADGKVLILNGLDEYGSFNRLVEIYDPVSKICAKRFDPNTSTSYCVGYGAVGICPGAGAPCYGGQLNGVAPNVGIYPRMHVMPKGLILSCGHQINVWAWSPTTSHWNLLTQTSTYRHYGTSFLLPLHNVPTERGKILLVGGSPTTIDYATTSAEILDFDLGTETSPVLRQTTPTTYRRKYSAPIILPNGKCAIFGGSQVGVTNPVLVPEIFDPDTETWESLPAATVPRVYHQVSLLLSDGRVWTAGSTVNVNMEELRTEIYSPAYLFQGPRPIISGSPTVGNYGGSITIPTNDAPAVTSVSLVRLMATTHHYDANQRLVWLQIINKSTNSVTVSAPLNANIAPPGYYMIHILNTLGVPSVAKIIAIPGTQSGDTTPPARVSGLSVTTVSDSQLNLSWTANAEPDLDHYNVYRGNTAGFPVNTSTDTPLARPTGNSFSNASLSSSTTYYYRVVAVDTSGNIGNISNEASGTTATSGVVIYDVAIPGSKVAALNTGGTAIRFGEEAFTASSVIVGKSIKTWKVRLKKAATPSGPIVAKIRRKLDDSIAASFNETIDSTKLGTSFAEYTFTLTNPYTIQSGDRILIEYSGPAAVHMEIWNVDKIDGSNTRRVRYDGTIYVGGSAEDVTGTMVSNVATPGVVIYDVAIPGSKAAALNTGGTAIRFGEEAFTASSVIVGKSIKTWKVRLKKAATPSGPIVAKIRRKLDDSVAASFNETIDSTKLGTSFAEYTFTLTNPYTIQSGDRILIEYSGPASVHMEIWNVDKIDGSNTRRVRYDGTMYVGGSAEDISGTMKSP